VSTDRVVARKLLHNFWMDSKIKTENSEPCGGNFCKILGENVLFYFLRTVS
jgi:hypothetical protein